MLIVSCWTIIVSFIPIMRACIHMSDNGTNQLFSFHHTSRDSEWQAVQCPRWQGTLHDVLHSKLEKLMPSSSLT